MGSFKLGLRAHSLTNKHRWLKLVFNSGIIKCYRCHFKTGLTVLDVYTTLSKETCPDSFSRKWPKRYPGHQYVLFSSVVVVYLCRRSSECRAGPVPDSPDVQAGSGGRWRGLWQEHYWDCILTPGHMKSRKTNPNQTPETPQLSRHKWAAVMLWVSHRCLISWFW